MSDSWLSFWQEKNAFDDSMSMNYEFFLKKVEQYVQPSADTIVLDIGSGPGHLEDAWYNRVKEIHAVDVSVRYNEMARHNHRQHPNVMVYDLSAENYLDYSFLPRHNFNLIIVMSVLQYYKNKEEIIALLKNIKDVSAPGAVLLLCDLMVKSSFVKEILQLLKDAWKEKKLFSMLSLFVRLRFSKYYKIKQKAGFLVLSDDEWREIFRMLNLQATFISEPVTLQKNRKNVLIQF